MCKHIFNHPANTDDTYAAIYCSHFGMLLCVCASLSISLSLGSHRKSLLRMHELFQTNQHSSCVMIVTTKKQIHDNNNGRIVSNVSRKSIDWGSYFWLLAQFTDLNYCDNDPIGTHEREKKHRTTQPNDERNIKKSIAKLYSNIHWKR